MKALIIDDELNCRDNLKWMLEQYCPEITLIQSAGSANEARQVLEEYTPDVVFLDIQMPRETGIAFLESLEVVPFSVIFTTAYNEYALRALKLHAFDYLEKPLSIDELNTAVKSLHKLNGKRQGHSKEDVRAIVKEIYKENDGDKIAVAMREGFEIVNTREIVHLEAQESYTAIHLSSGQMLLSSKNIKVYEDKLDGIVFFRIHKSHIINMRYHLKGFNRIQGNSAVMSNGKQLPISRRKLQPFLDRIGEW
jgi:two-component system LytT family response regulator